MKQGEPLPPAVREYIKQVKTETPGLTHQQIADKVLEQHGLKIDKSTVGKITRGLPATGSPAPVEPDRPTFSRHQEELLTEVSRMVEWLSDAATPLPYISGTPRKLPYGGGDGAPQAITVTSWKPHPAHVALEEHLRNTTLWLDFGRYQGVRRDYWTLRIPASKVVDGVVKAVAVPEESRRKQEDRLQLLWQKMSSLGESVSQGFETLQLRGVISGRCRWCPGAGTTAEAMPPQT